MEEELHQLREQIKALTAENQDLKLLWEGAVEHGDLMEAQLQAEINERKLAQATLQSILQAVQRSKADLEIVLETMVEHGETVTEYELCNQAVELMRKSEEQFRTIAEATPIAMMMTEMSAMKIIFANAMARNLLGENVNHQSFAELIILDTDRQRIHALLEEQGEVTNYQLQMYQCEGLPFWGEISIHQIELQGKVILLHTISDITERKRLESKMQQSEAILKEQAQLLEVMVEGRTIELQEAEAKYRSIFENAVEGIYQSTPDGRFLVVNPALARIYGYNSPEELIRSITQISTQLYVNPDRHRQFIEIIDNYGEVSGFESDVYRRDGNIIWISENAHAVRDEDGNVRYYEGIVQDITARRAAEEALRKEQEKSERLLLNILPRTIAERLKEDQTVMIAESYLDVTILFADIVGFTRITSTTPAHEVVSILNQIFSRFDHLAEVYGLEKIKTIGDEYMVVGGVPDPNPRHATAIAEMALAMQKEIQHFTTTGGEKLSLRIGINTGAVIAGVIGQKKFIYDLWGDAVNLASRLESQGEPDKIQLTEMTYLRVREQFKCTKRGGIPVKGKGVMTTYWLEGKL
jgi:PAS domain S-box-containing protein